MRPLQGAAPGSRLLMTDGFRDRHALVTGGGRGIGRAIAAALVAAGAKVTVVGRDPGPLGDVVTAGHAHGFAAADVTDPIALQMAADTAAEDRGPVGLLVANAGGVET